MTTRNLRRHACHAIVEDAQDTYPSVIVGLEPRDNLLTKWPGANHGDDARKASGECPMLNEQRRAHADQCERGKGKRDEEGCPAARIVGGDLGEESERRENRSSRSPA